MMRFLFEIAFRNNWRRNAHYTITFKTCCTQIVDVDGSSWIYFKENMMDENGLPITGAGVNYAAVEAINQRELITYVNMFLVRTCSFMNNFATKCEAKLTDLHSRLQVIDTSITLLESKLNSVDELKNVKLDATSAPTSAPSNFPSDTTATNTAPTNIQSATELPPPIVEAVPEQISYKKVSEDDRYRLYFKMLKMGVAEEAIRTKMRVEGVDPDLLSNPDAPAPPETEE